MGETENGLQGEIRAMHQDLLAALGQATVELKAELRTELRGAVAELRAEFQGALAELRTELQDGLAELRAEIQGVRAELRTELQGVHAEIGGLRKAVELIAVSLLSGPEVQKVRKILAG